MASYDHSHEGAYSGTGAAWNIHINAHENGGDPRSGNELNKITYKDRGDARAHRGSDHNYRGTDQSWSNLGPDKVSDQGTYHVGQHVVAYEKPNGGRRRRCAHITYISTNQGPDKDGRHVGTHQAAHSSANRLSYTLRHSQPRE